MGLIFRILKKIFTSSKRKPIAERFVERNELGLYNAALKKLPDSLTKGSKWDDLPSVKHLESAPVSLVNKQITSNNLTLEKLKREGEGEFYGTSLYKENEVFPLGYYRALANHLANSTKRGFSDYDIISTAPRVNKDAIKVILSGLKSLLKKFTSGQRDATLFLSGKQKLLQKSGDVKNGL